MVRFGIIGTNWITDRFLEAAKRVPGFVLKAVYSRTEEKAQLFAEKHDVPHTFNDIKEMADSGLIDAVYIATPNSLHAEQSILCMDSGLHVLCEKPLASNEEEVIRMMAAAKRNNVLLMEALKTTFIPSFRIIQENLHKIGPVRRYFSAFCQYSSRYDAYKQGTVLNAFNPTFSNGSLMDIGIYCLYPALYLFGKPKSIQATASLLETGVDGQGSMVLQYDGMEAVIIHSKITQSDLPSEIQGEDGSIIIDKISSPSSVKIIYRDGRSEDLSVKQDENTMIYEAEEFIRLIHEKETESDINTLELSRLASKTMEAARKQAGIVFPADKK
ncbi:MAG: Gfo/Idh/MocA family protein [Bacillus sp. (in: firmicutes)]